MYEQTRNDLAPYRAAGATGTNMLMGALPELSAPITLDSATLQNLPGYSFALRQGLKAAQSGAAARGLGQSGAAVKGAAQFATGLANQTANDAFNRELSQRNQRYNQLLGASQLGSNAASQTGQFGVQTGQQIGSNLISGGTAQAAGLVGAGNALTTGAGNYLGYDLARQQMDLNRQALSNNLYRPSFGAYGQF